MFSKKNVVEIPTLSDYGIFHEVQDVANEYFEKLKEDYHRHQIQDEEAVED